MKICSSDEAFLEEKDSMSLKVDALLQKFHVNFLCFHAGVRFVSIHKLVYDFQTFTKCRTLFYYETIKRTW